MTGGNAGDPVLNYRDVDLTISIVTWNSAREIGDCLLSIPAAAEGLTWEATVVDNASTDNTVELLKDDFREFRLLRNSQNVGFGAAHNQAMRTGVGRFHLILNPDTVAEPRAFTTLLRYLDEHPEVAMAGPAIFETNGTLYPSCRSFPTPGALLFRNRILGALFPQNPYTRVYLMAGMDHDQPASVDWLSGATLMASRAALENVGLLDARFFMYCEDMDWCRRAHDNGWAVHYQPAAKITHLRARSTDQKIPAMILEHHISMWKYYRKHELPHRGPLWTVLVWTALAIRAGTILMGYYLKRIRAALFRR